MSTYDYETTETCTRFNCNRRVPYTGDRRCDPAMRHLCNWCYDEELEDAAKRAQS